MKKLSKSPKVWAMGLALGLLAACSSFGPRGSAPVVGQPIINFTLTGIDGKPFNIADQKGKIVLINVFATW